MISLAARDIRHSWGKYVLTGLGLVERLLRVARFA